jgi:hypothetical protein
MENTWRIFLHSASSKFPIVVDGFGDNTKGNYIWVDLASN